METFFGKRKLSTDANLLGQTGLSADTENHSRLPMFDQFPEVTDLNVYPCFLPGNHCIYHIENFINYAKKSIIIQAYRFSSVAIGEALIDCVKRRVIVKILIDKGAFLNNSYLKTLEGCGVEIQVDRHSGKAHNKIIIIDDDYVITGSYNFKMKVITVILIL
ncbi:hypothetical protein JTE90_009786 [Oedothorax gibbosus]|uniref:Mitochondrial cardiolipin hydrolase n=1 Tax=Oedothorax gibbosus TaxID=931172 RepID=A0AAV6V9B8_9ARAC|nr:hypothetical protein JTE90_009786 [Oedothorax gibbosus]